MNEPNMPDDPLVNSLKQMPPQIPADVKSRLLYECGAASAEKKHRQQRKRFVQVAAMAMLLATIAGGFIGNRFTNSVQQNAVVQPQWSAAPEQPLHPIKPRFASRDKTMLTAATPISQLWKLLDHEEISDPVDNTDLAPWTTAIPFSTLSVADELENL